MFMIELATTIPDLEQILALQRLNHSDVVHGEQRSSQGFVTMQYNVAELQAMAGRYQHVVAKAGGVVAGYCLVMLRETRAAFPFLMPIFDTMDAVPGMQGHSYFVMGQVCVAESLRGSGAFAAMYGGMREQMRGHFDQIATDISIHNPRSLRAHEKVGFREIARSGPDKDWVVVSWDWR
jgi:L-amino acid N-acyltransferase YncA